jgi:hypothetical protein
MEFTQHTIKETTGFSKRRMFKSTPPLKISPIPWIVMFLCMGMLGYYLPGKTHVGM